MSAVPKPWEVGFRANDHSNSFLQSGIGSSSTVGSSSGSGPTQTMPPPIPSRAAIPAVPASNLNSLYGGMAPFGGGLYGGGIYGRPFGFTDGSFGAAGSGNLTQLVESQLRPGFDSVYSVVQAFSSVSMMLESTYFALQNTVRAAVGMADHFQRIGTQLRGVLISFPLLAWLRTYIRRLLHWLGVIKADPNNIWRAMQRQAEAAEKHREGLSGASQVKKASWPIVVFFAVAVGGPLLIWRLLRSLLKMHSEQSSLWSSGQSEHYLARALFDFGASREDELSFKAGETLRIAPKDQQPNIDGWLLASHGQKIGLIPANYVNVLGRMLPGNSNATSTSLKETVNEEQIDSARKTEKSPFTFQDNGR